MPTRPVARWIHSSKDGETPILLYKTWIKTQVFTPEQWWDMNAQLRGKTREAESTGDEKDATWAESRFTLACLKSCVAKAKDTGAMHGLKLDALGARPSFNVLWERAKEWACIMSRPLQVRAIVESERVDEDSVADEGALSMEYGTPNNRRKRRRALASELRSVNTLEARVVRRRMFAFSPYHPQAGGPAEDLRAPYQDLLVTALAESDEEPEKDDEREEAPVLQDCDSCLKKAVLKIVTGSALPGGRADICDECVKEIAVGHPERVLGHAKYDRYVKFLIRKKAAARLKTCAFGGCERTVSGNAAADVGCEEHAGKLTDLLFMISEGDFVSFSEEGALALLQKVSAASGEGRAGEDEGEQPGGSDEEGTGFLTCAFCKGSDKSVGGFEMTFDGGKPGPRGGERLLCRECRASLARYMATQTDMLANFSSRGLSEREQWDTVVGYAMESLLGVPGARHIAGFGTAPPEKVVVPKFARCVDSNCKCTASHDGQAGRHCCKTCSLGTPCVKNYHQMPFVWPPETSTGGSGGG